VKLPRGASGNSVVKALERLGFERARQPGSHVRLARGSRRVTVPVPGTVSIGTLASILRQAGVELSDFLLNFKG